MLVGFHWSLSDSIVSSGHRDSFDYSCRSQQFCSLNGLNSSDFHFFQSFFQAFGDRSKYTNYNWYHRHTHVPDFFQFSGKVQVYVPLYAFFNFHSMVHLKENPQDYRFFWVFLMLFNTKFGLLVGIRWCFCISKSLRILCVSFFWRDSSLCIYLVEYLNVHLLRNSQLTTFPTQSCLVFYFFFCLFAAFDYVIHRFVSFST